VAAVLLIERIANRSGDEVTTTGPTTSSASS
jgi:hypothetical protein